MSIGIYKITSPNGKAYIGQSINIEQRKNAYKSLDCKRQPKLFNSIKKHGWDKHQWDILEECTIELLDKRETHYKQIELDKVDGNWSKVLFCGLYDSGGGPKNEEYKQKLRGIKRSQEFKDKISRAKTGHICYQNPERGNKISKANKGKPKPEGFGEKISIFSKGKERSEEIKQKMRKPKTFAPKPNARIPIIQYDLEGNFIKEWSSTKEASEHLNIGIGNICGILRGSIKKPKKYLFKYKNQNGI